MLPNVNVTVTKDMMIVMLSIPATTKQTTDLEALWRLVSKVAIYGLPKGSLTDVSTTGEISNSLCNSSRYVYSFHASTLP